jgi:hypothetical protein
MWLELRDKSLRTEGDVTAALDLPVLSQVPWIGMDNLDNNGAGKRKFSFKSRSGDEKKETVEV